MGILERESFAEGRKCQDAVDRRVCAGELDGADGEGDRHIGLLPQDGNSCALGDDLEEILVRRRSAEQLLRVIEVLLSRVGVAAGKCDVCGEDVGPRKMECVLGCLEQRDRRTVVKATASRPSVWASRAIDQYNRTRMYGSSVSLTLSSACRTTASARASSPMSLSA